MRHLVEELCDGAEMRKLIHACPAHSLISLRQRNNATQDSPAELTQIT